MAEFKKLINKQNTTHRFIERFLENLQKAGKDKLTPAYLKTRLGLLDSYWDSIQSTHVDILGHEEAAASDYCTTEQIEIIEECYVTTRSRIQSLLNPTEMGPINPRFKKADEPSAAALM